MIHAPQFIYGTAWKKDATTRLVKLAVATGFAAIDTANQPKHYSEKLVGDALSDLLDQGIEREQIFLQTKFTPPNGQDAAIPYDPTAEFETQVETSFKSSLEHLQTSYVDSYLLHGPYSWPSLIEADLRVWHAIEKIYVAGKAKQIGISNVNIMQLELLMEKAKIKPMVVQNRCFASQGWDQDVREFCKNNNIMYQGFSLLTANETVLHNLKVKEIAQRLDKTAQQIIFRFCIHIGIIPLTGTTDPIHMQQDLGVYKFELTADEIQTIEMISRNQ